MLIPYRPRSCRYVVSCCRGPPYQPSPYPSGINEEPTPHSTPIVDGSSPGEQQVQNKALLRRSLKLETSHSQVVSCESQRSALPLDHAWLIALLDGYVVEAGRSLNSRAVRIFLPSIDFFLATPEQRGPVFWWPLAPAHEDKPQRITCF